MKDKIFIKGNTVDNTFYYCETSKLKPKRASLCEQFRIPFHNFLYVGRFSAEKNIFQLLKAYKRLIGQHAWGLLLVGDGPQMGKIKNCVKKYAIKNVFMPGFQQKEEIPKFFAVSDVLILPSISEPWGLVVNEAMAAGLPVLVSSRCGCYPDIVKEGINGFGFDPYDERRLFGLMKEIVESKYDLVSMGAASQDIIRDYTPEKAAQIVLKTIEFVLNSEE